MRRLLAVIALGTLVVLAGCGGTAVNDRALNESASYDWDTSTAVSVTDDGSEYRAVYTLDNESELELSLHDELLGRQPLTISAVKFRYSNGTVVNASALEVEQRAKFTLISFPASEGQFAYTSPAGARTLTAPVLTDRSHEVVLPPKMRISLPVFGGANPGGYETEIRDDRVHLTWSSIESERITVDYYRERDILLFGGIVGVMALVAGFGVVYYRAKIRQLEEERTKAGLDVEDET